jgi:hypothetical protein
MRKPGHLKYKSAPVKDKAEYEASRLKAYEASTGIKIEHERSQNASNQNNRSRNSQWSKR